MTSDDRLTWGFITDVLDVMERHGYHRGDNEHTGQAIGLIHDVARIYDGTLDVPRGGYVVVPSSQPSAPQLPGPEPEPGLSVPEDDLDAVTLTHAEIRTVLTSLDLAADWKRDHAETCTYCADQSCFACELRLREARTYDRLAVQLLQDEQATRDIRRQAELHASLSQPDFAADKEAGQ
jgi:hypothetical protein